MPPQRQQEHPLADALGGDLPPGAVFGEFQIVRMLGSGGSSCVYLARQKPLDQLVALKISVGGTSEGSKLANLDHEHIVPVLSEQTMGRFRLLAMRYIHGITLAQLMEALHEKDRGQLVQKDLIEIIVQGSADSADIFDPDNREHNSRLPFIQAICRIVLDVACSLQHAHQHGILHRDVKPDNVLLTQRGRAMLFDFNVAVDLQNVDQERGEMLGGTLAYMSPEHLAVFSGSADRRTGDENDPSVPRSTSVDASSDVYSLGIVFYELLTGRRPFRVADADGWSTSAARETLSERLAGPPDFYDSKIRIPASLQAILKKCLAADRPADSNTPDALKSAHRVARYHSAQQMVEDLECFLTHRPLRHASDHNWPDRAIRWMRRHPRVASAALAIAVVVGLIMSADAWSAWRRLWHAEELVAQALATTEKPGANPARLIIETEPSVFDQRSMLDYRRLRFRRARLYHDFGLLCYKARHYEQGIEYFEKAIDCNPNLGEAYNNLGVGLFELRRFEASLNVFNKALELGYDEAEVLANRGASRVPLGDLTGARKDFERAIQIDPKLDAARKNLALLRKVQEMHKRPNRN